MGLALLTMLAHLLSPALILPTCLQRASTLVHRREAPVMSWFDKEKKVRELEADVEKLDKFVTEKLGEADEARARHA